MTSRERSNTPRRISSATPSRVYAHYFRREHIGAIKGFAITLSVAGTAFGPLLLALGTDRLGGYAPSLLLSALPPLVVALAAPFLRPLKADGSIT